MRSEILLAFSKAYTRKLPQGRGRLWLARKLCQVVKTSRSPLERTQRIHAGSLPIRYKYSARNVVGVWLELFGAWEESSLVAMVTFLRSLPEEDRTMLDIGANYGLYALTAACHVPAQRAYAFECDPQVVRYLEDNVHLNQTTIAGQGGSVTVVNKAVSPQNGTVVFWQSADDGDGSLLEDGAEWKRHTKIEVGSINGEGILQMIGGSRIGFAKIDVQGAEVAVVEALRPLLESRRISRLQIEVTNGNEIVLEQILAYGYQRISGKLENLAKAPWNEDFVFDLSGSE